MYKHKLPTLLLGLFCLGCTPADNPLVTTPRTPSNTPQKLVIQPGSRITVQDELGITAKTVLNNDGKTQKITLTKGEAVTEFNAPRGGDITIRRKVDDNVFFIAKSETGAVMYNLTFHPQTLRPDMDSQATLRNQVNKARAINTSANPASNASSAHPSQKAIGIRTINNRDGLTQTVIASLDGRRTALVTPLGALAGGVKGADGHYTVTASNGDAVVTKAKLDSYTLQPLSLSNAPSMPGALTMSVRGALSAKIQPNGNGTQTILFSNTPGTNFVRTASSVVYEEISPLGTHVRVTQNHQGDFVVSLHNDTGRTMRSFILKKGTLAKV